MNLHSLFQVASCLSLLFAAVDEAELPKAADPRLTVTRFAAAPDIVHPVSMTFDSKGRLLVIESHTHFPPMNYAGPKHDRIKMFEDTDGDGKADRITTFFEGTRASMDLALHPDGSIYLATRNEILRLGDTKGDGKADQKQRIVFLETKGDYPHNGLSGLSFDSRGNLIFGMGENLGAGYRLIGSDGQSLSDEGEGGNIFRCTADGKNLRRFATGFWNPFGTCTDIFGRIFAVDNDPDAMPPCRLIHVVEGGDYGYQFRYGRSGRHPFQSWNGQLHGTLPMASGTGEAPCKILSYESDGLPQEYLGNLLVASWADHRIERYVVNEQGASVRAERKPFIQGGKDFRPVGIAVAPDGSLFVSDWVLSDYQLHGKGAIWHIQFKDSRPRPALPEARRALTSQHRPLREAAAQQLADSGVSGRQYLRQQLESPDVRARAVALTALIDCQDRDLDLAKFAETESVAELRAMAVKAIIYYCGDGRSFLEEKQPANVRMEALASLTQKTDREQLIRYLVDADPFLRHAAMRQLARFPSVLDEIDVHGLKVPKQRIGILLAQRANGRPKAVQLLPQFLADPDSEVRFLAAKWIADRKVVDCRPMLVDALNDSGLSVRLYLAFATALARIDNLEVNEGKMAEFFASRLNDKNSSPALRVAALRSMPATQPQVTVKVLTALLENANTELQLETVRMLNDHADSRREALLWQVAQDRRRPFEVCAEALVGVAAAPQKHVDSLLDIAQSGAALGDESLRALVQVELSPAQRNRLEEIARQRPALQSLVNRIQGKRFVEDRPAANDIDGWLKKFSNGGDPAAGRRVFFHPRLANCSRCHRVDGRGQDVGPDLSAVGRNERRHILAAILQPDSLIGPHYQVWRIVTKDGRVHTGMLVRTVLDEYTYVDPKGEWFKLNTRNIEEIQPIAQSIMPTGLVDQLTDREISDLLAYLSSRR